LIDIRVSVPITAVNDDDDDDYDDKNYIFSAENGDNWFYFEDQSSANDDSAQCAHSKADPPPLQAATRSADGTTLIQFKYDETPTHEVLHAGRCRFTGLVNVDDSSSRRHRFDLQL
jgi:hypothetical protein